MPISEYFGGKGERVAAEFKRRYGARWQQVFFATAHRQGLVPGSRKNAAAAKRKK